MPPLPVVLRRQGASEELRWMLVAALRLGDNVLRVGEPIPELVPDRVRDRLMDPIDRLTPVDLEVVAERLGDIVERDGLMFLVEKEREGDRVVEYDREGDREGEGVVENDRDIPYRRVEEDEDVLGVRVVREMEERVDGRE